MPQNAEQGVDSTERIIQAAGELFAAKGYHGVTTREIAAAVGLNVSTVNYHVGGKHELYREVFRRLHAREHEHVTRLVASVTEDVLCDGAKLRELLFLLVDSTVDVLVKRPEIARLWVRRWLESPVDFEEFAAQFSVPLFLAIRDLLERAQGAGTIRTEGLNLRMFLMSFTWMLYGYFTRGAIDWESVQADPFDARQVCTFRGYLHDYVVRMLDLPHHTESS